MKQNKMYIERKQKKVLNDTITQFPVIFLTGPRQSGKTTLLKHALPEYKYVSLEDPDMRYWALDQPRDFLRQNAWPVIIDEAQYAPELFSYIQLIVDEEKSPGMFILSGSQNFLLMEKITQSLAGRSAVLTLLPFSYHEIKKIYDNETNNLIINGFYPRIFESIENISLFYKSYINTYVERDVRQLANIGNINDFIRFVKLCAGRSGQLLNISSLATEAGIAYNTCKSWLSYLTTGYIIHIVSPYYKNFNKKIIKAPKLYFTDTGLLCHLLGIDSVETLSLHSLRGAVFENFIYSELLKGRLNLGLRENIWFWRDNHGTEIDFIKEERGELTAVEIKSGMNFHDSYLRNLYLFKKYNPDVGNRYLIYDGMIEREKNGVRIINWRNYDF